MDFEESVDVADVAPRPRLLGPRRGQRVASAGAASGAEPAAHPGAAADLPRRRPVALRNQNQGDAALKVEPEKSGSGGTQNPCLVFFTRRMAGGPTPNSRPINEQLS